MNARGKSNSNRHARKDALIGQGHFEEHQRSRGKSVVCHRADAARPAQQDPVAVVGRRYGAIRSHAESKCEIPAREGAADLAELQLDLPGFCAAEEDTFDFFRRTESHQSTRIILTARPLNTPIYH